MARELRAAVLWVSRVTAFLGACFFTRGSSLLSFPGLARVVQHRVSQGPPRAAARVMCFWLLNLFRSHGSPPLTRQLCQICSAEHLSKRLARSWSVTSARHFHPPPNPKKRQARANSAWLTQPLHRNPPWPWPWRLANPTVPTPCLSKSQRQAFESKVLPCNALPTPGLQRGSPKSPKPRALH